jgi:hypothetical protein
MKKAGKYNYLYELDTEISYDWLRVWVDANHPSFQNFASLIGLTMFVME